MSREIPPRRADGRRALEPRRTRIAAGYLRHAEGSALISAGATQVLCAVSLEEKVPDFLRGSGRGWLTAEYSMLPRATHTRSQREANRGKISGRTHEIQRLIGRSLRAVVDLSKLGERTLFVDCDVLQADGGTRTAAINGAYVAVAQALDRLVAAGALEKSPLREPVAAISVGLVDGELLVDLAYTEDSTAEVDANFVMTGSGGLVEVQGTAEGRTFARDDLSRMLDAAWTAVQKINLLQEKAIESARTSGKVKRKPKARASAGARKPKATGKTATPAAAKSVPAVRKTAAAAAKSVPAVRKPAAAAAKSVPAVKKTAAAAAKSVPAVKKTAAAAAKSVPAVKKATGAAGTSARSGRRTPGRKSPRRR